MKRLLAMLLAAVVLCGCAGGGDRTADGDLDAFLADYDVLYRDLWQVYEGSHWDANSDICEQNTQKRIAADKAFAEGLGAPELIARIRGFLERDDLSFVQRRRLEKALHNAAAYPGTIPETVDALIAAEAAQNDALYSHDFRVALPGSEPRGVTPNEIVEALAAESDLDARLAWWEASKEIGPGLRDGLLELRGLRNETARALGFSSFFGLEVSDYGMDSEEMMALMAELLDGIRPIYEQLHCWARHELAARYGAPVPRRIPAHWIGNRWAQAWPGIVEGVDLDALVADKEPEWLVRQAASFYVSMGLPELPEGFWRRSDLYALPADAARRKNTHASAWHIDLDRDVRSLMSVTPTFDWFQTTHHELGHIYYYLLYSNPDVPFVLRTGANRAFHEAVGTLIELSSAQAPYLRSAGLLNADDEIDQVQWLLNEALLGPVVFLPFACGTMTHWEHDFYEDDLPGEAMNARWWEYAGRFQGIAPPAPRGEEYCDPATKTHISDDPAQYYDYAISYAILHQLHAHVCREILHCDTHAANYFGQEAVGSYLRSVLEPGATRDWRELMVEATGEPLSARALLEYYAPLQAWLEEQNAGRDVGFD